MPSIIAHPAGNRLFAVPEDYVMICVDAPNANCAAAILNFFEQYTRRILAYREEAIARNEWRKDDPEACQQDTDIWIWGVTVNRLQEKLFNNWGRDLVQDNLNWLIGLEFIKSRKNPYDSWDHSRQFLFNVPVVQKSVNAIRDQIEARLQLEFAAASGQTQKNTSPKVIQKRRSAFAAASAALGSAPKVLAPDQKLADDAYKTADFTGLEAAIMKMAGAARLTGTQVNALNEKLSSPLLDNPASLNELYEEEAFQMWFTEYLEPHLINNRSRTLPSGAKRVGIQKSIDELRRNPAAFKQYKSTKPKPAPVPAPIIEEEKEKPAASSEQLEEARRILQERGEL